MTTPEAIAFAPGQVAEIATWPSISIKSKFHWQL
jgi:hypothetical protein